MPRFSISSYYSAMRSVHQILALNLFKFELSAIFERKNSQVTYKNIEKKV